MSKVDKTILLVDDDQIFLTLAEIAIKKVEGEVMIYKTLNGEEALEFLKRNDIDLIFLDLNMPVMNGWELLDELLEKKELEQKIFVLTSSIDPGDKRKASEHPLVHSMIEKPLDSTKVSLALGA